MPIPGVDVSLLETPGSVVSIPTDTGVAYVAGLSDKGRADAAEPVYSLDDFINKFGTRQAYSAAYDWVQTYFREGGDRLYFSRVVGPAATQGTHNLLDAGAAISLVATALGPGDWSANYKVAILAGSVAGTFIVEVVDASNVVLEDSGNLLDQQAAVTWSQGSKYIRLSLGASALDPAPVAATALSAGTDDRANITDAQWTAAYIRFPKDLGPGQVAGVGRTSTTGHDQLVAHAEANNRVALLDLIDSASEATLAANVSRSRFAAAFAPWVKIPGLVPGSTRTVPASAVVAGLLARNDPSLGANHAAAGRFGISNYAVGLSQAAWDDSTRQTLNSDGVNVIRQLYGSSTVYGWRSTVDHIADPNWVDFGNARLFMRLSAELDQVGQNYLFDEIDGQNGQTIGGFHDALAGVLLTHFNLGELFGTTADEAFQVDTGPGVNTLETISNHELRAICYVKMSPFAEHVVIQIVKRAVEEV
jgi:hypothetical protein